MLTPDQEKMREAAKAADSDGHHIYMRPRDSNNWRANSVWHEMASPAEFLALLDQVEAQGWQPIETAPRDGYMLVYEDGAMRALLRFNGEWQHPSYPAIIDQWGSSIVGAEARRFLPTGCRLELRDGCCENPTHWQPLPPPPEAA